MTKNQMIEFLSKIPGNPELAVFLDDKSVPLTEEHMIEDIEPVGEKDWPIGTIIFFID